MAAPSDPLPGDPRLAPLWRRLLDRLDKWDADWLARTGLDRPRTAPRTVDPASPISNTEAFEAFAVALVSGNTRWERIERIRGELDGPFLDFRPHRFAHLAERDIDATIMPWFRERRAGAAGLRGGLLRLRETARLLAGGGAHPSANALLEAVFAAAKGSPEGAAMLLGSSKEGKLPGFGIALAAEALRLLGFDLCKPDRHVLRAIAAWGLVRFARWDEKGAFTAPQARSPELLATMLAVRTLAEENGVSVSYANSLIWNAGAVSGARLTNDEFRSLVRV